MRRRILFVLLLAGVVLLYQPERYAQSPSTLKIAATSSADIRSWDTFVDAGERSGRLRMRARQRDPNMPSRVVERLEQFHQGVRVWGAQVVRDTENGRTESLFGVIADTLDLSTQAVLTEDQAAVRLRTLGGAAARLLQPVELVVLPLDSGSHALVYTSAVDGADDVFRAFVDANTGVELLRYTENQTQSAVGTGRGVLGDQKKVSARALGGAFYADDQLRPPVLITYDFRGDLIRMLQVNSRLVAATQSDFAVDADNNWTDVANVDAHVHVGWAYDYYFKRFGRRGLDDNDRPVSIFTNSTTQVGGLDTAPEIFGFYVVNASWCTSCGPGGLGRIQFGSGMPPGWTVGGQTYTHMGGALDLATHELTHGVLDSSSRLIYRNESGALNEAFADIMGTSAEFFYHPGGTGPGRADYLIAEDVVRAGVPGALDGWRSMANPGAYGDPDHYTNRFLGLADEGGVHTNSAIANHAFYLAIESGTNRTSGLAVQGVGAANREQIETVFYRAFVYLLPANATFAMARATTIQAARDLYGAGGNVERAVTQAWTAVGVQ